MGILCDPKHPALADFPTEAWSDWQWWHLITGSKTMILDELPAIDPVVRVIDNFFKNRKMANIIEANVSKGKLLLVSADLSPKPPDNRPWSSSNGASSRICTARASSPKPRLQRSRYNCCLNKDCLYFYK